MFPSFFDDPFDPLDLRTREHDIPSSLHPDLEATSGLMLAALALILLGLLGTAFASWNYLQRRAQGDWPQIRAAAVSSYSSKQGCWMKLELTVDGKPYRAEAAVEPCDYGTSSQREGYRGVDVYYNPANPRQVTFQPGLRGKDRLWLIAAIAALLLGCGLFALVWITSQRQYGRPASADAPHPDASHGAKSPAGRDPRRQRKRERF